MLAAHAKQPQGNRKVTAPVVYHFKLDISDMNRGKKDFLSPCYAVQSKASPIWKAFPGVEKRSGRGFKLLRLKRAYVYIKYLQSHIDSGANVERLLMGTIHCSISFKLVLECVRQRWTNAGQ
jgi:hypothetical protein